MGEQKANIRVMGDRSRRSNQKRHVFTYQTRVLVTPEQDKMLREYGVRFGRVERTLYGDLQKGEAANQLKAEYLVRFAITARRFNAARIQLQGKIEGFVAGDHRQRLLAAGRSRSELHARRLFGKSTPWHSPAGASDVGLLKCGSIAPRVVPSVVRESSGGIN